VYDPQAVWEWLLENGSRFRVEEDGGWDEDAAYEAILLHFKLKDSQEMADSVFPLVAKYAEYYT
jgi:hypothetical protein